MANIGYSVQGLLTKVKDTVGSRQLGWCAGYPRMCVYAGMHDLLSIDVHNSEGEGGGEGANQK